MRVFGSANDNLAFMKIVLGRCSRGVQGTLNWLPGNTIHINLRKHDPIGFICSFIHIYQFRVRLLLPYT